jgi:microcystin degradation protein MlrC
MSRILIAGCQQEISTFNPQLCKYDFFEILRGDELVTRNRGKNSAIGGAIEVFEKAGHEVVPTWFAEGLAAGPLEHASFMRMVDEWVVALSPHAGKVDAAYFSLHGSMGTPEEHDPEGYLLAKAREIFGEELPITISLDLHGVLTAKMMRLASGVVSYHTYPHVDFADTGSRAAAMLLRIMGGAKPVGARVRIPALVRGNELKTATGVFGEQVRYMKKLHEDPKILSAGFLICNPFTDVPELCCQPFVYTDGDQALAEREAVKLANDFWPNRAKMQGILIGLEESVSRAAKMKGPVAFTDAADATSSGASGDSNAIIAEMARQRYPHTVLAPVVDPALAAKAWEAGVGGKFRMGAGGSIDTKRFKPLELDLEVVSLSDEEFSLESWQFQQFPGKTAALRSGVFTIVATSNQVMHVDRALFLANGQDPKKFHSTIVKSPHCEPQFFDDWVEANLNVDAPGSTSANLKSLGHTICARPMYPLDEGVEFVAKAEVVRRG